MPLLLIDYYTRELIRSKPNDLFVFGDNMARIGMGGQAASARNEPNTVGIPTLWSPGEFFCDADYDNPIVEARIQVAFVEIRHCLHLGVTVHYPSAGVGTGIADLANRAPKVLKEIQRSLATLEAGEV
jgi:hypothetical protein